MTWHHSILIYIDQRKHQVSILYTYYASLYFLNFNTILKILQYVNTSYVFCSLFCNILQSFCVQHLTKSLFPVPLYLNLEKYGWKYNINNISYEALMADQPPARKHIVELYICQRRKGIWSFTM